MSFKNEAKLYKYHGCEIEDHFAMFDDEKSPEFLEMVEKLNEQTDAFCFSQTKNDDIQFIQRELTKFNAMNSKIPKNIRFCGRNCEKLLTFNERKIYEIIIKKTQFPKSNENIGNTSIANFVYKEILNLDLIFSDQTNNDQYFIFNVFWSNSDNNFALMIGNNDKTNKEGWTIILFSVPINNINYSQKPAQQKLNYYFLRNIKPNSSVSWSPKDEGIFYMGLVLNADKKIEQNENEYVQYFHILHKKQCDDLLIYFNYEENGEIEKCPIKSERFLYKNYLFPCNLSFGIKFRETPSLMSYENFKSELENDEYQPFLYEFLNQASFEVSEKILNEIFNLTEKIVITKFCGFDSLVSQRAPEEDFYYVRTNHNAPMWKLIKISMHLLDHRDHTSWQTIIAENKAKVLSDCKISRCGQIILAAYIENIAELNLYAFSSNGALLKRINPEMLSYSDIKIGSTFWILQTHSFLKPRKYFLINFNYDSSLNNLDFNIQMLQHEETNEYEYDLSEKFIEIRHQIETDDKNGLNMKIPIIIICNRNLQNSPRPCILYGYGAFNEFYLHPFKYYIFSLLKNYNGIFAVTFPRGDGVNGQLWREMGRYAQKHHSLSDFNKSAKFLIQKNYTDNKRLIAIGRSFGAFLVTASATMEPSNYAAVVGIAGRYDPILYPAIHEFGDPKIEEHFLTLKRISPYQNITNFINKSEELPPYIFLLCGLNDQQIRLSSALKYVLALNEEFSKRNLQENLAITKINNFAHLSDYENILHFNLFIHFIFHKFI